MLNKKIEFKGQSSLVILILSVCVIAIVMVFFVALRDRVPNSNVPVQPVPNPVEVPPKPVESFEIINNFETPPLTDSYNWEQISAADDDLDYYIWYDNRYKQYVETEGVEVKNLDFNGRLYKTVLAGLNDASLEGAYNIFTESYLNNLKMLGWIESLNYKSHYITGLNADGVTGKVRGVVKKEGDMISTVIVAASFEGTVRESPEEGISVDCPCNAVLKVFIGDPVSIELITTANFVE